MAVTRGASDIGLRSDVDRELAASLDHFVEEDTANLAKVKVETLEAWRKRGRGPAWVRFGNTVLYPRSAVKAYLESLVRQPGAGARSAL